MSFHFLVLDGMTFVIGGAVEIKLPALFCTK